MKLFFCLIILSCCHSVIKAQFQGNSVSEDTFAVSAGIDEFTIELLLKTAVEGGDQLNVVLSTYSIWTLLAILNDGAEGTTSNQLKTVLRIPNDSNRFRFGYKNIKGILNMNTTGIELSTANVIFTEKDYVVNKDFELVTSNQYNVNFLPIDFTKREQAAEYIDAILAKSTNNRLKNFINFDDLADAKMLLTTAIFFKGQWSIPFNKTATKSEPFYDERGKVIGNVEMMYQTGLFPYTRLENLQAHAVALPYGQDEKYWMVVIKPWDGVRLTDMLTQLVRMPFKQIIDKLKKDADDYPDDVIVYFPKFKMVSDFVLNVILEKMGIIDVFDPVYADLSKISKNLFLSRVIHKAEIEVNEEGTIASAVTEGSLVNKQLTPEFRVNRSFAYFIVEKETSSILFAGKLSNPNDLI